MTAFRFPSGRTGIDRSCTIHFTFDGARYPAHPGDTIASALMANGVMLVGRSFKLHRPRGVFGAGLDEPNALVTVGAGAEATPNCLATMVEVEEGMTVSSQNRWPSLKTDLLAVNQRFSRFLGAGFYYKTFMRPRGFWEKLYEPAIRKAAGLGKASVEAAPLATETVHHHCDCLVIGGGAAGLEAASSATGDVILCEALPLLPSPLSAEGGAQRRIRGREKPAGDPSQTADRIEGATPHPAFGHLLPQGEKANSFHHLTRTTVVGAYDHGCFAAVETLSQADRERTGLHERLHIIRAAGTVLATGAQERLIAFDGNDKPGVMLAGAALSLFERQGVVPGRKIILFANNDRAYAAAEAFRASITAIIDPRSSSPAMEKARAEGMRVLPGSGVESTEGKLSLRAVLARSIDGEKGLLLACDALLISGGFNPSLQLLSQAGGSTLYDERIAAFVPSKLPANWTVLGDAAGMSLPAVEPLFEVRPRNARRTKAFVDLQGDVTADDIRLAAQEGYVHVEHAKRYTTHGMGTDQGKTGGLVGAAILAEAQGRTLAETGVSKPRPFVTPTSWAALAGAETGAHFKPIRRLPLHSWHEKRGAVFLKTGLWLRPLYYTATGETGWAPVLREARMVRASAGVTDVSSLGKIDVQGPDAAAFLDRIYANTISTLKPGMSRYGLMLREDGMVFDDGTVARFSPTHFVLSTTTANAAAVLEHMEFHAAAVWPDLDVTMTSISDHWAQLAVAGPNARKVAAKLASMDVSNNAFPFMAAAETTLAGIPGRLFRISFSGELAYELAVPAGQAEALMEAVLAAGAEFGIIPYGLEALSVMRVEKGHVTSTEITGRTTADDLGFGKLLKKSGDFIGAAMAKRPALLAADRQQLVGVRLVSGEKLRGGAVLLSHTADKRAQGHVTAVTQSVDLNSWIGLALLENGRARHGETLIAASPVFGEKARVEIVSPHHVDPENARVRS